MVVTVLQGGRDMAELPKLGRNVTVQRFLMHRNCRCRLQDRSLSRRAPDRAQERYQEEQDDE